MPQGIEVIDAAGVLVVSTTSRLGKVLGSTTVSANGSVSVPGFAQGTGFFVNMPASASDTYPNNFDRAGNGSASISGTTLSWSGTSWQQRSIVYGVF